MALLAHMIPLIAFACAMLQPSDARSIHVAVHVRSGEAPVIGVPLCIRGPGGWPGTQKFELTDKQGDVTFEMTVPKDASFVVVLPREAPQASTEPDAAFSTREAAANA